LAGFPNIQEQVARSLVFDYFPVQRGSTIAGPCRKLEDKPQTIRGATAATDIDQPTDSSRI
jgi:hypothetical protein